jgi:hypothetical protein
VVVLGWAASCSSSGDTVNSGDERQADGGARQDGASDPNSEGGAAGDGAIPYPTRTAYRLKGLQPDFWSDIDEIANNNTGGIAVNLVWAEWEPALKAPPCAAQEEEYDGHCFVVSAQVEQTIREYSKRNVVVTGVVYGVPAWARAKRECSPASAGFDIFCAPDDAADYGRFAGFVAQRFDGRHERGRVADFVVHNEVNSNDWFDVGCGQGKACDIDTWVNTYAANYAAAYDRVMAEQSTAKVLVSLEHHFGPGFADAPTAQNPIISGTTLLTRFAPKVAPRAWRVAYHPYAPNLLSPAFSADDAPLATYGNIGVVPGWLRQTFPNVPSSWVIQLTESGVNSAAPQSSAAAQATAICDGFRNIVGTPGIESYIYHRMVDHPTELAAGLGLGLRDVDKNAKPAWTTWATANRIDLAPPKVSCGFEDLPYTRLTRSYNADRGHWASTRIAPPGFGAESSYRLLRDPPEKVEGFPEAVMLYECRAGTSNFVTRSATCEGQFALGPLGCAYDAMVKDTIALYRCRVGATDHMVSTDAACEGQTTESLLGYVFP